MRNVLQATAYIGVFLYVKNEKIVGFFDTIKYLYSCYGVKGRYFTLFQMAMEGGGLLWCNQSSSEEQLRVRKQFDSFCKTLLKNETINYEQARSNRLKHEVYFSELTQEVDGLFKYYV